MAVVAVCIAYIQLTVTQCGIFIEYAIFQYYVADFAFGCGYFAVFIYNQFAVGSIECTVAVYKERYSAVFICSTYGQVVFCVQCIGLNGVYTGNVAFFIDSYLTKLSGFRSDLAVVAVCITYIQLTVTQCGIFIEHAIFQNYVADFAFGCGYFAVFIYNQFAVGSIECTVAVYKERYSAVFICSTYGQVVFCVQCIGLNGVYTGNVAFFIDSYLTKLSGFRSDLAVVAVCITYIQLTVTQCGIFIEHAISARDFCNMLHFSLLNSPRSANLAAKNAKTPEAGKPASRAIMINFILLSVPGRTSSDNGTRLHG